MSSWFESQIEVRARLDKGLTERAYAELAASVSDPKRASIFSPDQEEQYDSAICACLKYCGVEPGVVPEGITDPNERLEWFCRPTATMYRVVVLDDEWYKRAFGALLGTLDTGETVAMLPVGIHGYCYIEPGTNRKIKITKDKAQHISSEAISFYKPLPVKPLKIPDLMAFIAGVFDRNDYLLVVIAAVVATLISLLPAWANSIAFGTVVPSGRADFILPIGALLVGVAFSRTLINASRSLIMARMSTKIEIATEAAGFSRLLGLPSSFFKNYASGNLAMRLQNISTLSQTLTSLLLGSGLTAILSIVYVFQIAQYAAALAIPALLIALLQAVIMGVISFVIMRYEEETLKETVRLSGLVTALLNGVQKIKLAGAENRAFAKWAHAYARYAKSAYNRPIITRILPALVTFIGLIGMIVLYYFAATTNVSMASFMAFNVAYGQLTAAILELANISASVAQIQPMLDQVEPILEATPETAEDKPSVVGLNGMIEVSGVSFRYNENSPYIVKNLSFRIKPGEYVALVGKSGCGKSTILRLLLGFEKPERGSIFYGTYNVQKVNLQSLRQHIGTVMQDGKLFMGDLMSNITISAPTATLDDAWAAAEIAGIADDIRKMPMGMQTLVTEGGGGVSGGQRQRIMIARAVCGNRRILMFDEATSALDNVTQKHVSDSLDALKCTRVVVAHRLSTVRHCDRILVVDGGGIAEEGTYDELIAKKGIFAELVERQRLEEE